VSWAAEVLAGIRKIVLIEHRMDTLTEQVKQIALACQDLDRRLLRMEAKFELLERMAAPATRRSLPEKSEK
jgi:ubiquinone biosynthesis protein UbiJ